MVNGGSTSSLTLNNLEENTLYTITVQSITSDEISANSNAVSVTTYTDGNRHVHNATLGVYKKVRGQSEAALQTGATKNFDIS